MYLGLNTSPTINSTSKQNNFHFVYLQINTRYNFKSMTKNVKCTINIEDREGRKKEKKS